METMVETIVCWYLQGNHHSRVSWAVQDFVHPQYGEVEFRFVALPLAYLSFRLPFALVTAMRPPFLQQFRCGRRSDPGGT